MDLLSFKCCCLKDEGGARGLRLLPVAGVIVVIFGEWVGSTKKNFVTRAAQELFPLKFTVVKYVRASKIC